MRAASAPTGHSHVFSPFIFFSSYSLEIPVTARLGLHVSLTPIKAPVHPTQTSASLLLSLPCPHF